MVGEIQHILKNNCNSKSIQKGLGKIVWNFREGKTFLAWGTKNA